MSIQTTLARQASVAAATAWRMHKATCPACQSRRYQNCTPGEELLQEARRAREEHRQARNLDRQPSDGQEVFDI